MNPELNNKTVCVAGLGFDVDAGTLIPVDSCA